MARFRRYSGGFKESVASSINVNDLQELQDILNIPSYLPKVEIKNLKCEYYCKDARPDGYPDTYLVTGDIVCNGEKVNGVFGFADAPLAYVEKKKRRGFRKFDLVRPTTLWSEQYNYERCNRFGSTETPVDYTQYVGVVVEISNGEAAVEWCGIECNALYHAWWERQDLEIIGNTFNKRR